MHSNYNNMNNNNHQNHDQHQNHSLTMSDNGLHYFFNGLKLLNQKCNSPPSPIKNHFTHVPTSLHHQPQRAFASYQAASCAAADSADYCTTFTQEQQNIYQCHQHQYLKNLQVLNNSSLHRKNSPPELVHHNNKSQHHHNNNNHQLQSTVQVLSGFAAHPPHAIMKSSDSRYQANSTKNTSTDKHYQHYYSYYYNRQPSVESATTKAPSLTERRIIRKLPTHRMASTNKANDDDRSCVQDSNISKTVSKYLAYTANGDKRILPSVLREKMPNNNIILNAFTTSPVSDDDEWLDEQADGDITNEFIDVKDCDDFSEKLLPLSCDPYDTKLQTIFNAKCKLRMSGGEDAQTTVDSYYNATSNKKNYSKPSQDASDLKQNTAKKLPSSLFNAKAEKEGVIYSQKKLISPPAPRVLLYNNQSPRPSMRHLPRLSPSSLRMRDFRRMRAKSPSLTPSVVIIKPLKNDNRKNLTEIDKNTPREYFSYKLGSHSVNESKDNKGAKCQIAEYSKTTTTVDTDNNNQENNRDNKDSDSDDDDLDDDLDNVSDFGDSFDSNTSSDSENGYRSHAYKLTHSIEKYSSSNTETSSFLNSQSSYESLTNPESLLVPSLFPNVPPFLSFSSNTSKGPDVPAELYRILKWRVTNVMPKVVRCVLANSGVRLLKKTNDWMGIWGKHMKSPCFKTIRPYQKINHLPGSFKIGRKDACWKNLQRQMLKHGRRDFGFMPKTFIIPHDLNQLRKSWPKYAQRNVKWIIKPPASARGAGIRVVDRWAQIPKRKPLIVQKYIERPLLINGSKFDLRLYVLVTSMNPLRVFLYHNGLARFASVKYSDKSDTLHDRCMHLTNYSINKFSSNYSKNEDVNACHGHKWTIKSLWSYLSNRGIRTDLLWEAMRNLVLRTILAGEHSIHNMLKVNVESKYSCFELFGFDVLLDAELVPWLLEVNISPSLHSELPLDSHVKAPLVQGVLNTALYNVPPKLSLEKQREVAAKMSLPVGPICFDKRIYINYLSRTEKVKHNTFTRKSMEDRDEYINSILENLTPDDVRCLIVAEDELARCSPLERIFPTSHTHKYLKYTDVPRYYNRLLDAWESRYAHNRNEGIALLRDFCALKYHLEVPPTPAKKASSVDGETTLIPGADICCEIVQTEESQETQ